MDNISKRLSNRTNETSLLETTNETQNVLFKTRSFVNRMLRLIYRKKMYKANVLVYTWKYVLFLTLCFCCRALHIVKIVKNNILNVIRKSFNSILVCPIQARQGWVISRRAVGTAVCDVIMHNLAYRVSVQEWTVMISICRVYCLI